MPEDGQNYGNILLVADQLNAQILVFFNKFIIFLYMFRAWKSKLYCIIHL